ncbi:MAG: STAS domain-containing protein [Chthoniobacteraceae bacterium]
MKLNRYFAASTHKQFRPHIPARARTSSRSPQPFTLLLTTNHPDSSDEGAGEVVRVPAEFNDRTVIIDLNEVTRIDSWGLALFIEAMQRITACGGNLVLIRIHEDVRRVLETAQLDCVFPIFSTREEALAEHGHLSAA